MNIVAAAKYLYWYGNVSIVLLLLISIWLALVLHHKIGCLVPLVCTDGVRQEGPMEGGLKTIFSMVLNQCPGIQSTERI